MASMGGGTKRAYQESKASQTVEKPPQLDGKESISTELEHNATEKVPGIRPAREAGSPG